MKKIVLMISAALSVSALTGCSWLNTGHEEYSCSGMPDSVYCRSARDVYQATNSDFVPSPVGPEGAYNEECSDCARKADGTTEDGRYPQDGGAPYQTSGRMTDEVIDNFVTPALPDNPIPIRTPSQVMRIWVAPYVDTNGDLVAPGFVYTEIEPRRWIVPDYDVRNNQRTLTPLKGAGKGAPSNFTFEKQDKGEINALEEYKEKANAKLH